MIDIKKVYPEVCNMCQNKCEYKVKLKVKKAFYQRGNYLKVMFIGQDPTVDSPKTKVNVPLMLDKKNSRIRRWLTDIVGKDNFDKLSIYATNLVKCIFEKPPTKFKKNTKEILKECFEQCKKYLSSEIDVFEPDLVITFGEPTHIIFSEFVNGNKLAKMKNDFNGQFIKCKYNNKEFL